MAMTSPRVFTWLLDIEPLWPYDFSAGEPFKSTGLWAQGLEAQHALALLSPKEQAKVLAFYRYNDAKLCLGSCLLKRRAISDTCDIPWADVIISADANHKPCYVPESPDGKALEFNVSHHGSLVTLVGCSDQQVKLGVDVMRLDWEKDYPKVREHGFSAWAHTYEMVFSDSEVNEIANYSPSSTLNEQDQIREKLRNFYAHWCMKEAYGG